MEENQQKFENFSRNLKKSLKIPEILVFFSKINPYRKIRFNEANGQMMDSKLVWYYCTLTEWLIDILLNGFFLNFVLSYWLNQPLFNLIFILVDGISLWLIYRIAKEAWKSFIDGMVQIARSLPKK